MVLLHCIFYRYYRKIIYVYFYEGLHDNINWKFTISGYIWEKIYMCILGRVWINIFIWRYFDMGAFNVTKRVRYESSYEGWYMCIFITGYRTKNIVIVQCINVILTWIFNFFIDISLWFIFFLVHQYGGHIYIFSPYIFY